MLRRACEITASRDGAGGSVIYDEMYREESAVGHSGINHGERRFDLSAARERLARVEGRGRPTTRA